MASKKFPHRDNRKISASSRRLPAFPAEFLERRTLLSASVLFGIPLNTTISASGSQVAATAIGDVNGDGIPDVIASRQSLQAQVFLGTPSGALTAGQIVATGATPITLGTFTADSKLDLVTSNGILPGNGDGTFGAPVGSLTLPANTVALYSQDVNGDGKEDLIAATFTAATVGGAATQPVIGITVLIGNGNGTFQTPLSATVGTAPNIGANYANFQFGDFSNNSKLDILTPFGVMLGNGDGTFSKAVAFPFTTPGAQTPPLPSAPDLAIGDFNGDGNLDVVTVPANGATGQVEIFLGNGKSNFSDNGPISVGSGNTVTTITTNRLAATGNSDLLVGVVTATGAAQVAVLTNNGSAVFGPPAVYSISGPAVSLDVDNFNNDGIPDLLTLNELPNASTSTTTPVVDAASVLLGAKQAGNVPTISLKSSTNPAVDGETIMFTATLSAPSGSNLGVPTGSVTFFNGTTAIGTVTIASGVASLGITATGIGQEPITVQYSGDTAYIPTTSAALSQIVLATSADVPLLFPSVGTITLPTEFLPGDKGKISVIVTNGGNGNASGKVTANLFLSTTPTVDSSSIALNIPKLANRPIHLLRGRMTTFTAKIKAGTYPAGFYYVVAQLVPAAKFTTDEISQTPAASASTFQAAGMVFGTVGNHRNLKLNVTDPVGHAAKLSIKGPGSGTVTLNNGLDDIAITGATSATTISIKSRSTFSFDTLAVTGDVHQIAGNRATSMGGVTVSGGVKSLILAGVGATGVASVPVTLGGGSPSTLSLGNVGLVTLTSVAPIANLTASAWAGDAIDAPSIGKLTIAGQFGADLRIHAGGALQIAKLGGVTGGNWAIPGGIGSLKITGSLSNTNIFAGTDTGPDNTIDTADDVFIAANIGSIFVGGSVTSSLIVAGGTFPAGSTPILPGLMLLPNAKIGRVTVRSTLSSDSRILAAKLPGTASIGGMKVKTGSDARFEV